MATVITNAAELKAIENDMAGSYILGNDIDLGGANFEPIGHGSGFGYTEFTGTFDGNGYKIHNGTINYSSDNFIGLFAYTDSGAEIKNVGLEDVEVTGAGWVGGLVGYNWGTITNSYSTGNVSGDRYVGGLVGQNYGGTITNSYSTGSVTGDEYVGGLVGANWDGTITNSYSTGSVSGNDDVGGLVGENYEGTITNSYSTGSVEGEERVGGLVGRNYETGTIENSYSTGSVTGDDYVGGLVGRNGGDDATITNSYYDYQTSGQDDTGKGEPKTTAEMKDINTFLPEWDIALTEELDNEVWGIEG